MTATAATPGTAGYLEQAAVEQRYRDVDPVYAETRDLRMLGFVLFLLADCILFSSFVFAYLYLRTSAPVWPPVVDGHQIDRLDVAFGAMNSIVLFGSGVTMHFALHSWKHLNRLAFNVWLVLTILLGIGFLSGQAHEYLTAPMNYTSSTFGASFFTLTGLHGFHVFCGVVFLAVLGIQANRGVYTGSKYFGLIAGTLYWHFVDVIWVALFFLFYLW